MDKEQFSRIRRHLAKTQTQMAGLLGISLKAVQSFEQGWRNIPVHAERQMLFLMANRKPGGKKKNCWTLLNCPLEVRRNCPAWEFQVGHLCWFINGTICRGEAQASWRAKMKLCRDCAVFESAFPDLVG